MINHIDNPLHQFEAFKNTHTQNVKKFFEELVKKSNVDEVVNTQLVEQLNSLEEELKGFQKVNIKWDITLIVIMMSLTITALYLWSGYSVIIAIAIGTFVYCFISYKKSEVQKQINKLTCTYDNNRNLIYQQMEALNQLYDWNIFSELVSQTLPDVNFDTYFSNARLHELVEHFQYELDYKNNKSVICSHSGEINSNPFVLAQTLHHWMDTKTYTGSRTISWTEKVCVNGKWENQNRHETLTAIFTSNVPQYETDNFIVFGHDTAPKLSFSRSPSNISHSGDGIFGKFQKKNAIKKLEKKSRDIKNDFNMMANAEFDCTFGAVNRDNELQFRLLFTPLAQQNMLTLLSDKNIGFGDDFYFTKNKKINTIRAEHLNTIDSDAYPSKFHNYDLKDARVFFNTYHNTLFKSFYFSLVPLLTIPLYQQTSAKKEIGHDVFDAKSCYWEHESIANFYGESTFKHELCDTRNILKTQSHVNDDGTQTVAVTAYGYQAVDRIKYISVRGDDGCSYDVPVDWIEYILVERTSSILVQESNNEKGFYDKWKKSCIKRNLSAENYIVRRSIFTTVDSV